jgi:hypothetical protein
LTAKGRAGTAARAGRAQWGCHRGAWEAMPWMPWFNQQRCCTMKNGWFTMKKMCFTMKNGCFTMKQIGFTMNNWCFTMKHGCFTMKNWCFTMKKMCFTMKNLCFTMKNGCFTMKNVCFTMNNWCFTMKNECFTMKMCVLPSKMVGLSSNGWVILVWYHGNLDEHCGVAPSIFMVFEE